MLWSVEMDSLESQFLFDKQNYILTWVRRKFLSPDLNNLS